MARTARNVRRLLAAAALAAAAAGALLLARSGEAATPLTLTTITIDGNLGDWDAVLANPLQTTRDGDGQSWDTVGECALYSTDRDCPVLGGIGNDLYTFAWTYDASYVYLFIERYTGTTTGVDFFFVADTDQDKLVESAGDVVIRANWKGQSGDVAVTSGPYVPVNTLAGDPIATVEGYVDGYKLPGNNGTLVDVGCGSATGLGVTSGADDGRKAEIRVPWCAFGVAPLQPFLWHVASSNTVALSGAVDNIGAPSGKLGTFVQRAVSFFPDRAGAVLSPGSVEYTHTLVNDGNEPDVFDFVATSSQGARVELVSGGTVIGRDDQGDGTWELPAAARPQVLLAVGASQALQIRITMPSGRTGQDVTRVTARSVKGADEGLTVTATVTDSSHVGSPAFVPEVLSAWTQPGVSVAFAETLVNGQLDADTFDLLADGGCAGHELRLTTDSAGANLAARDDTGDGSWDFVDPAHDTVPVNGAPDLGPIAGQSYKTFWLWVTPPAGAPYGACAVRLTALSPTTGATAHADHTVTVAPAVAFAPSYTRAAGTSKRVGVNDAVTFAAVIRNSESVPRAYALSQVVTPSASGASARVWSDPNGDGSPADGLLITTTGTVAPFGGAYPVVVELLAGSAPSGTALSVATTATATAGGASATQTSEADVGYLATYADALLNDATSVFAPCSTVYLHATGLALSNTTNYTLRWLDPASNVMRTLAPWPTTARGIADDAWALAAGAALGDWRTQLVDGPGTRDQELTFTVELIGDVSALATDRARYRPGDAVQVTGSFRDGGRTALAGSSLGYTLDGAPLRTRTGVTVPAGATVQDPFSFVLPADAAPGLRTLVAGWTLSCGATPFATRPATFEVQPLAPAITSPAPGARLKTHTPVIQGTAVAGASVTVTIGGSSYAPVTAAGDGTWSFTAPSLPDGSYTASAVQAVAGVPSDPSAPVTFTLDTTAPGAPVVQAIASPTNAAPVPVPVTAEAGSTVALFVGGAPATATLVSADAGTFTFDVTLAEGTWSIQATAADDLGNTSALSAARSVVVDRTPPAPPVLAGYPLPVNDDPVAVLATAAAGSTVRLSVDGAFVKEMAEGPAGTFTATLDLPVDDSYGLTATAADPVGNVSGPSASVTLVVDRTAPDAPVIAPVGSPTNADPVVVTVTAEEGANVSLELDGAPSGVAPGVSGTTYTFPLLGVASGEHAVVAVATDSAGNPSLPSEPLLFDVDRIPPAVPAVQPIASPTKLQPVPVTVAIDPADVGATVQLRVDGAASAATPVSVSGTSYAFELTLTEGPHTVAATAADALGNVSALSAAQSVTVDRTAPATPVVTPALPAAANGDLLLVAGTAEVGATVTVTVTGSGLAPVPAPAVATGGTFSVYVDFTTFPDDVYAVRVQATDAAGNPSVLSAPVSVRVDRVAPGAPTVSVPATSADPVVVSVTAEAGTTVVLVLDGTPRPDVQPA